jgi:hypothetical protein
MKKLSIIGGIVLFLIIFSIFDWQVSLFLIPFLVGVVFVVWNALEYSRQMDTFAEEVNDEQEFDVVEKDGLTYVTPRGK